MATNKAKKKADPNKITTPVFRVRFASVFNPRSMENDDGSKGTEKYGLTMIFDEDADLSKMKKLAKAAAKQKWGDKLSGKRMPFRDGEEKEDHDGFEAGMTFCSASTQYRPGIVDRGREPIIEQSEFYDGCYARATVHCFTYEVKGNKGVSFGLNNIQKVRDGEILSGNNAADDFDEIDDDYDDDDEFLD